MRKRSLFEKIFGTNKNVNYGTELQVLDGFKAQFTNYNGKLYDSSKVRSCIDAIARNGAKLSPKHIRSNSREYTDLNNTVKRLISEQPNEMMNAYQFYYKVISTLYLDNNAFIFIQRDEKGNLTGLYPIKSGSYKLLEYENHIFIQFSFAYGKKYTASLEYDVIHLKRFFCNDDIMGGDNTPITQTMSFKHIVNEGIINAIKTTQGIKGVIKTTKSMLKPEDQQKMRDDFVKDITSERSKGIAGLDATMDFKEVNINPQTATDSQVKDLNDEIKDYYGINDAIIQSNFSEEQWNAFYESVLEPIGIQMSLEFTNKLFTLGERFHGNKIIFEANRLQYASNNTKISIVEKANNIMTINEMREIFNLAPIEDGDRIMQDLNHIDNKIANNYQGGSDE